MASSTMAVAGSSAAVVAASVMECRSASSSTFGSVRLAPVVRRSGAVKVNATVRASVSEEPKVAVKQAMVGLLAAGAILVSGMPAFAAAGPGGDGAARTAREADKLLTSADKLTKNDSPPTFKQGVQDTGSTAKQAGSAASANVENVADAAVTKAKENLAKAKESFGNVIKKDNVSDASGIMGNQAYTVSDASSALNDAKSNATDAVDDAKNAFSSFTDKLTGNAPSPGTVASDVQKKASDAVSDTKGNLPSIPSGGVEKKSGQKF